MKKLFIPDKIKVGYQHREGTYTGKLAYVIYYDKKGVLRKEGSWKNWCHFPGKLYGGKYDYEKGVYYDQKDGIEPQEFDNVPTEGFVLNKKAGGYSTGWNHRQSYIRVYDPRDFEFEITPENLLFILSECDCTKGKGIEGEFVYAWDGKDLVLLPCNSSDYKESKKFSSLQNERVYVKDLILGGTYVDNQTKELIYLGKFDFYNMVGKYAWKDKDRKTYSKKFVFWNKEGFDFRDNVSSIARCIDENPIDNYDELVDQYNNSINGSEHIEYLIKNENGDYWYKEIDGKFYQFVKTATSGRKRKLGSYYGYNYEEHPKVLTYESHDYITIQDKGSKLSSIYNNPIAMTEDNSNDWIDYRSTHNYIKWENPTSNQLYLRTKNGNEFKVTL